MTPGTCWASRATELMLAPSLRRGLAAGLVAGLLTGLFALAVGHAPMAEAIRIEEQDHHGHADDPAAADPHDDHEHVFSRGTQQLMLPVATGIAGTALGGLFGLVFAIVRHRMHSSSDWSASIKLATVAWAVTAVAPTLTFPANPPGVGDPGAVGSRTSGYLLSITIAAVIAVAAWGLSAWLRRSTTLRVGGRQVIVGTAVLATAAVALTALPRDLPGTDFPAELLWQFRLASFAVQSLLWAATGATFGLLWDRASAPSSSRQLQPA